MKSPMFLNTPFFFLFVMLATTLPSTRAINLFDDSGEPMRNGGTYYMLPVATGRGGGGTLRKTGNDDCPLTIVQDTDSSSSGLPVTLTQRGVYYVGEVETTSVQFVSKKVPSCAPSPAYWGTVDKNLKVISNEQGFRFQKYHRNPSKYQYVIADCRDYDRYNCRRVVSINNTLFWTTKLDVWVVKFKWTFVNSERPSWSVV